MAVARIRVVAKPISPNASRDEREKNFRIMFAIFKRAVNDSGILTLYKERQYFESKSVKRRNKKKLAEFQKNKREGELKTKVREHFG